MTEDVLNLQVGALLQLQSTTPSQAPRYNVRVVGYFPGGSLVVTTPTVNGKVLLVREGQRFNIRMLRGNSVMGFVAKVLQSYLKPYAHLHFEYPSEVESIMVRDAYRVAAGLSAVVRNTKECDDEAHRHIVTVLDLSSSGAKLSVERELAEPGDMLHVALPLDVAGQLEKLALLGTVRNRTVREAVDGAADQRIYGVQFRALNRFQQLLLHAWVLERVAAEAAPSPH